MEPLEDMLAASVLLVGGVGVTVWSMDLIWLTVIQDNVEELDVDDVERIMGERAISLSLLVR